MTITACYAQSFGTVRARTPHNEDLASAIINSDLVNAELSDGTTLSDADLMSHLMSDLFVGGSKTTTNAMSEGILLLCRNPAEYAKLMVDLDRLLPKFIEEALRLESPVQGLYRVPREAVSLHGVDIPAGALINLRFGGANRDEHQFEDASEMKVDRDNSGSHLAFGSGIHHCVGASLARRELHWR